MNKKIPIILLALIFLICSASAARFEPLVAYSGETINLSVDEENVASVEIVAMFNETRFIKCENIVCPKFENGKTIIEGTGPFKISTSNAPNGNYLVRINFIDEEMPLYSSFVVKTPLGLYLLPFVIFFIILLILVEKNVIIFTK